MVVSKIPYERYKIENLREAFEFFKSQCNEAKTAEDVIKARTEFTEEIKKFSTAASLAHCRFTQHARSVLLRRG